MERSRDHGHSLASLHRLKREHEKSPPPFDFVGSWMAALQGSLNAASEEVAQVGIREDPIAEIRGSQALQRRRLVEHLNEEQLAALSAIAAVLNRAADQNVFIMCGSLNLHCTMELICSVSGVGWDELKPRSTMHTAMLYLLMRHIQPVVMPLFGSDDFVHLLRMMPEFEGKDVEALSELAAFADCMALLSVFLPLSENKLVHMEVASWLSTNVQKRFVPGGGQTKQTTERVWIYQRLHDFRLAAAEVPGHPIETMWSQASTSDDTSSESELDVLEHFADDNFWFNYISVVRAITDPLHSGG